jgi:serine phosphatase RsbU (regulator of sigma subunit)/anti-sigma regulatory factor (Ser/Thr protein kinase)
VPLVSQGELIGMINLGPRRSEQDYSTDDKRLLGTLATQAAPALRVAQMARQQQAEARQRERYEQELRVASVVQQTLLPQDVPTLEGWKIATHWQPARAVSGDFYDFIHFPDGRMGFIVADVTDKGIPAALVMATSRSVVRTAAEQLVAPGAVLELANNLLYPNMPSKMFVTCLYALLDPATGVLCYANAGHNPPYQHTADGGNVRELFARGMPLGLMPDMPYEEKQAIIAPGDSVVMYSDGLIEAHNPQGEMFGYPRLHELMALPECGDALIHCMLDELHGFTGSDWEQEDDVTFVTIDRLIPEQPHAQQEAAQILAAFGLPSRSGEEKQAMQRVAVAVEPLGLEANRLERLKTAVAEAVMNAMEHGNRYQQDLLVEIEVLAWPDRLVVRILDQGGETPIATKEAPDLEAKLDGLQSPRGWGLFLIRNMVDEMHTRTDGEHHIVELVLMR